MTQQTVNCCRFNTGSDICFRYQRIQCDGIMFDWSAHRIDAERAS